METLNKIILAAVLMVTTMGQDIAYEAPDPLALAAWPTPEEYQWLAKAVAGEVGVMGPNLRDQAGSWVIHVAYSRVAHDWFPDDLLTVIQQGFNGAWVWEHETPPMWAYVVVNETLRQRLVLGNDPTAGSLFLFGGQDIVDCMDFSLRYGMLQRPGWVFSVHLFLTWPYPDGCWYE